MCVRARVCVYVCVCLCLCLCKIHSSLILFKDVAFSVAKIMFNNTVSMFFHTRVSRLLTWIDTIELGRQRRLKT